MAGDSSVNLEPSRSCCAVLKERYSKLEEKRNALRQAVKLLEHQIDKLQSENLKITEAYEDEQVRAQLEVEAKVKESAVRIGLENEISNLKSEIGLLQEKRGSQDQDEDRDLIRLQTCVSEGEIEISQLKDLLEKEKKRAELERKKVEGEKKKAAEAWKVVKSEKNKFEEERRLVEIERSRAEECRLCIETLRTEANEARVELASERSNAEEAHRRLESEKQKANKEKERADSEMAKAQEQRKCAEDERKKAMDEKNRSDYLSQQLEGERQRNEALQKEIQEIISTRKMEKAQPAPSGYSLDAANANMMILKKQLKLEKMRVKHTKRVAKLEKVQNDLLQQEVHRLKQDFLQFYRRLNVLDDISSHRIEGTDASAKFVDTSRQQSSNLKRKLSGKESCEFYTLSENELLKACYTTMDGFDRSGSTLECTAPLSGGSCAKPISGISSELESVIGGSVRNKSQNPTIFSNTTSYSDRPLMGSQGRCALSVSTSAKLTEENSKQGRNFPRLSDEITKLGQNENLGVVAENNVRSSVQRSSRKKNRLRDAMESIEYLYSEDKQLHLQIEEKLSVLHDMLILKENMPSANWRQGNGKLNASGDGSCPVSTSFDNLYDKSDKSYKKRKVSQKQKLMLRSFGEADKQKQSDNLETEVSKNVEVFTQAISTADCFIEAINASKDEIVDAVGSKQEIGVCFEEMVSGDYMKLLELDNAVDEESYRMAMEMPLSPTLPEIELHNLEPLKIDDSKYLVEETFSGGLANEKDNLVPFCSFDVINVEIDSNKLKFKNSSTFLGSLLHQIKGPDYSFEELKNNEDDLHIATGLGKNSAQISESSVEMAEKQMHFSGSEGTGVPCARNGGPSHQRISKYFVLFSNNKDKGSISKIISARERCMSQCSMDSRIDSVVQKILLALTMEQDLLPEEKACVFFSLLLHNFSVIGDFSLCSNSFSRHMETVMSDLQMRHILLELCQLTTLLCLIEDFLIDRRVLLYNDLSYEPPISYDSENSILLVDDITVSVSSKTATVDQLEAGSIILASICVSFDHIGFLCEASYKILLMHRSDSYLMLTVLHVFASLCGDKYFTQGNYALIMPVIKSIVTLLERENELVGSGCASYLPSPSESRPGFPPCIRCLFSEGAVSLDEVLRLLLEKLQKYVVPGTGCQHMVESSTSSNCSVCSDMEKFDQNSERDVGLFGPDMDFDDSCVINTHGRCSTQGNSVVNRNLHHLSDIVSLVELVGHYMRWDWTCRTTIPQLLKILESCVSEKYSAAILILLGQLGRLGIDDSGCEQMGVEELRCSLSARLGQNSTKWGLTAQFAVVHALMGLLPLKFLDLIHSKQELLAGTSRSHHTNLIRTWFSHLSEEQKSLSFGIFQSTNVHDN